MDSYEPERERFNLEVRRIAVWPLVRFCAILFLFFGLAIGGLAFLVFPHPSSASLGFSTRALSALLFAFIYTAGLTLAVALTATVYNGLASRLGWVLHARVSRSRDGEEI